MMLLSVVKVGTSIKLAIGAENNTLGLENTASSLLLTTTQISKRVLVVTSSFKYLV